MIDNRTFYNCFSTPDGVKVLEWFESVVGGHIIKKDKEGRTDLTRTACAGALHDLVTDVKQRIENGRMAR